MMLINNEFIFFGIAILLLIMNIFLYFIIKSGLKKESDARLQLCLDISKMETSFNADIQKEAKIRKEQDWKLYNYIKASFNAIIGRKNK